MSWLENIGHFGVVASLVTIAAVAVLGQSGLVGQPLGIRSVAVLAAVMGRAIIAISHVALVTLALDRLR